jgi:hypothetical protein
MTDNLGMYARYDDYMSQYGSPSQRGGRSRAMTARRDTQGRYLPKRGTLAPDPQHGRPGGTKRATTATRNERGQFIANT